MKFFPLSVISLFSFGFFGCASTSSIAGQNYKLSAEGYATQTRAPRKMVDPDQYHATVTFPTRTPDGEPPRAVDIDALTTQLLAEISNFHSGTEHGNGTQFIKVSLNLTESEFPPAGFPAQYVNHPNILYRFLPDVLREDPVAEDIAPVIRNFAVSPDFSGIVLTSLTTGYVKLEDGCVYLGKKGRDVVAVFPLTAGLRSDPEGYIEIYDRLTPTKSGARLGQKMGWGAGGGGLTDEAEKQRLLSDCGAKYIVEIHVPEPYPFSN